MRIVAGTAKGRALKGPKGEGIRPTADRVRQALFDVLGQFFDGGRVLDLYAGTGALALEALSRGFASAVLVDSGREALKLCQENAEALGFTARVQVIAQDADRALDRLGRGTPFELIFADPPYALTAVKRTLEKIDAHELLAPGGTLCLEHDKREAAPERVGRLACVDTRRFGDTEVSLYRVLDPSEDRGDA